MRDRDDGFILVSALTALALLALLVAGATTLVRSAAADAGFARTRLIQDALTHAGLESAAYQLFMLRRSPAEMADQRIRLDQGVVTLTVAAESGKVDLNGASADLLAALWRQTGAGGLSPESFAARVVDWRDLDDTRSPAGAEKADYAAAGLPGMPRDGTFETVDELQNVLGVGAVGALALKPFLTVHNPDGKVSVMAASRDVLRLVPGVDARAVDSAIQLRRTGGPTAGERVMALLGGGKDALKPDLGEAFQVSIAVEGGGASATRVYSIVKAPDASAAYHVTDVAALARSVGGTPD